MAVAGRIWANVAFAVCLLGTAAPAAACPTGQDMAAGGVFLRTGYGSVEHHQRAGPEMIRATMQFPGGGGSVMLFRHGLYTLETTPVVDGKLDRSSRTEFASPAATGSWPAPAPSHRWSAPGRGGGVLESGPLGRVKIGSCVYEGYDITIRYTNDGPDSEVEVYTYLPDLGIGLAVQFGEGPDAERYSYVAIQAAQ